MEREAPTLQEIQNSAFSAWNLVKWVTIPSKNPAKDAFELMRTAIRHLRFKAVLGAHLADFSKDDVFAYQYDAKALMHCIPVSLSQVPERALKHVLNHPMQLGALASDFFTKDSRKLDLFARVTFPSLYCFSLFRN